ncbi:hypothetical protein CDCA_CDCA08G2317 [Cyanidium caldarium]|uniref:YqgF/RNase H-like domain-containing protein n=1 Tax=Cyanidium caldarium TaxID=2771 RepID=A0AAV9IVD1_CYACA|nr:hypothetical protein CDCA_CDCA08G2317 [Cyanidium caldarium]
MAARWVRLFRLTRDEAFFAAALRGQTRGALLGLDVSDRHIGVALSDEERLVAFPLETVERRVWDRQRRETRMCDAAVAQRVATLVRERQVIAAVAGWPLPLRGGVAGAACERVCDILQQWGVLEIEWRQSPLPCLLWDERYSTQAARDLLGRMRQPRREPAPAPPSAAHDENALAAMTILQGAMDRLAHLAQEPEQERMEPGERRTPHGAGGTHTRF